MEALVFRIGLQKEVFGRISVGEGTVFDASESDDHLIFAVRLEWSEEGRETAHLIRSSDRGNTWEVVKAAPTDIVGVAFSSRDVGWVWSERKLYHTDNGGASWSSADAPALLPRRNPHPRLDSAGALWIAGGHGNRWDPEGNVIARARPDLQIDTVVRKAQFNVTQMYLSPDGDVGLLAEDKPSNRLTLMSLSPTNSRLVKISDFPLAQADYLRVFGREIVMAVTEIDPPFRSSIRASNDRGTSWDSVQPPESRVHGLCAVSQTKLWMIGDAGLVYAPEAHPR